MSKFRNTLEHALNHPDSRLGRRWGSLLAALIIVSVLAFALETVETLPQGTRSLLAGIELATVIAFTLEYAGRIWVAPRKLRYIASIAGIIDLLAILPYYLLDGGGSQVLRMFRLLWLLKLLRFRHRLAHYSHMFVLAWQDLKIFALCYAITIIASAVFMYAFEYSANPDVDSLYAALWLVVATISTVGYGDVVPVTTAGQVLAMLLAILSPLMAGVFIAVLLDASRRARATHDRQLRARSEA